MHLPRLLLLLIAMQFTHAVPAAAQSDTGRASSLDNPTEPSNLLPSIDERRDQKDSLFPVSPLGGLREGMGKANEDLYKSAGLKFGMVFTHVFQAVTDALPNQDSAGTATTADFPASLDLIDKGGPYLGQAVAHVQARWNYGTTGPEALGFNSLGSGIGTADTFDEYQPDTFVLRNLYWRQGSPEAGWAYRVGKITPDGILASSSYLDSQTTFLPSGGVSALAVAFPDSGFGAVGAWYLNEDMTLVGLVSDANADRFNFGDIEEGDLFTAAEFHFRIAPKTDNAGFSKITVWHTDGTEDGSAINAMLGPSGWGAFFKHEQELTDDGRLVGIVRYGKSFDEAAFYDQQAGAHLIFNEPRLLTQLKNDAVGVGFNWAKVAIDDARDEYNAEVFYRFPLFPEVDATLSYQSVINPAFNRDTDHASAFSFRLRAVF